MGKLTCPACGSDQLETISEDWQFTAPYAPTVVFPVAIQKCQICSTSGDFTGANDQRIDAAEQESKRRSIATMIEFLSHLGITMAYLERALELPPRTVDRWKHGEYSAAPLALLRIVTTYPWILELADKQFDSRTAYLLLTREAETGTAAKTTRTRRTLPGGVPPSPKKVRCDMNLPTGAEDWTLLSDNDGDRWTAKIPNTIDYVIAVEEKEPGAWHIEIREGDLEYAPPIPPGPHTSADEAKHVADKWCVMWAPRVVNLPGVQLLRVCIDGNIRVSPYETADRDDKPLAPDEAFALADALSTLATEIRSRCPVTGSDVDNPSSPMVMNDVPTRADR